MKVFSVYGICDSGKTMSIEKIITELRKRHYSVGSIKEIHNDKFSIDRENSNTDRHRKAGAQLVVALGDKETDILHQSRLPLDEVLRYYEQDFVVIEGNRTANIPKILAAHSLRDIEEQIDDTVFAITGVISNEITEYNGIPVINALNAPGALVDLIEEKVFDKLPDFDPKCCGECGKDCRSLCRAILKGEASRDDCGLKQGNIHLLVDGVEIEMVPFVKKILSNEVLGVVKEMDGYRRNAVIEIKIDGQR